MTKPLSPQSQPRRKTRYLVEMCTLHGPTRQRRWHRVHQGDSRADCLQWIEEIVSHYPTEKEAPRSFGLTRERAQQGYRVRGVRT